MTLGGAVRFFVHHLSGPVALGLGWILLTPEPLLAWGPGTHVALGEMVLGGGLTLLPPALQALLRAHPVHFLYGSIAADISFAKKYVPEGRHCHHWHVGEEILANAHAEPLRAVAVGYLAHLAADTVAHNLFVPRQLLLTSTTQALGHAYWEHRMDMHVGGEHLARAREIVTEHDHSAADTLFDDVLSRTLFSFRTNRRIFRGMIRFSDNDRWQRVFESVLKSSRFDLADDVVVDYLALSFDAVVAYLTLGRDSPPAGLDPIGDLNLKLAKKIRRLTMARGGAADPTHLEASANDFFPFPLAPLEFWPAISDGVRLIPGSDGGVRGGKIAHS
jgi:zinc dependent phospholipase C